MNKTISNFMLIILSVGVIATFIILDQLGETIFDIFSTSLGTILVILSILYSAIVINSTKRHMHSPNTEDMVKQSKIDETNQLLRELISISHKNNKNLHISKKRSHKK